MSQTRGTQPEEERRKMTGARLEGKRKQEITLKKTEEDAKSKKERTECKTKYYTTKLHFHFKGHLIILPLQSFNVDLPRRSP